MASSLGLLLTACGQDIRSRSSGSTATADTSAPGTTVIGTIPIPINQPTTTLPPAPSVTDSPSGATKLSLSQTDISEIVQAYESWTQFRGNCTLVPVQGTLKAATIAASGISWAFGQFAPPAGCTVQLSTGTADIISSHAFDNSLPHDSGVFEKQGGGSWQMNYYESVPFPCPDNLSAYGHSPGYDTPYVPLSVLNAVGVSYASGCENIFIPPAPR